jgi:hypothetical protein
VHPEFPGTPTSIPKWGWAGIWIFKDPGISVRSDTTWCGLQIWGVGRRYGSLSLQIYVVLEWVYFNPRRLGKAIGVRIPHIFLTSFRGVLETSNHRTERVEYLKAFLVLVGVEPFEWVGH